MNVGVAVQLHGFLTSALDGGEWSAFPPVGDLRKHIVKEAEWTP
jgi:hypothetical protein